MSEQISPSEQLAYSTVRIECQLRDGSTSTGTGYFFRFLEEDNIHIPAIVTNKHVIENSLLGTIHINIADDRGQLIPETYESIQLNNFDSFWIMHPEADVDLCIMPIAFILKTIEDSGKTPFYFSLYKDLLIQPEDLNQLTAIEDIIMIGYPNGIWDSVNNMPIIRKGITATHPKLNYNRKHEFMIDAACFPGSSGSPVFLFNLGTYPNKMGGAIIGTRIKLLGTLYAGPQHTATGNIAILDIPIAQKPISISRIPNNLGIIIKSYKLLDFEPILKQFITDKP